MGGKAFASHDPPLPTPRLELAEYLSIRESLLSQLSHYFDRVAVPLEGAGKDSYGDVDILVSGPKFDVTAKPAKEHGQPYGAPIPVCGDPSLALELILNPSARKGSSFAVPKSRFDLKPEKSEGSEGSSHYDTGFGVNSLEDETSGRPDHYESSFSVDCLQNADYENHCLQIPVEPRPAPQYPTPAFAIYPVPLNSGGESEALPEPVEDGKPTSTGMIELKPSVGAVKDGASTKNGTVELNPSMDLKEDDKTTPTLDSAREDTSMGGSSRESYYSAERSPKPEVYVQVDVTILKPEDFDSHFFMLSHGDFWNMLSPSLRRVGLCMTHDGLYVIHPTIETQNKKRARQFLTNNPSSILNFLGFNEPEFWGHETRFILPLGGEYILHATPQAIHNFLPNGPLIGRPFDSERELFVYVCSSPFFNPNAYAKPQDLKSNDRRRMRKRGAYQRFYNEWVPQHYNFDEEDSEEVIRKRRRARTAAHGPGPKKHIYRAEVTQRALQVFNKKGEWEQNVKKFIAEREDKFNATIVRLTREVEAGNDELYVHSWVDYMIGRRGVF